MLLKNLMEDKKLNLDQPLLSVRKYTPILVTSRNFDEQTKLGVIPRWPPSYTSELNSGPVSNPGAVPFNWEHIPGQPKQDMKHLQTHQNCNKPPLAPKLPPGRYSKANSNDFERRKGSFSGDCDESYVDALDLLSRAESYFVGDKDEPSFAERYSNFSENDEERDGECHRRVSLNSVFCLLPRLCIQSSVCILHPVPAVSVRTQRIQPRSSSSGSYIETEDELYKPAISELKPADEIQRSELKDNKASLKNENGRLASRNTLTYCDSPPSITELKEVFSVPDETKQAGINGSGSKTKGFKTFQELLADEGIQEELDSAVHGKTVYVDSVDKVESMKSCSANTRDNGVPSTEDDEIDTKTEDQTQVTDSSLEYFLKLDTENVQVLEKEDVKNTEKQLPGAMTYDNSHERYSEFPVPPALPKSPSDSWLRRTLPTICIKHNVYVHTYTNRSTNPRKHGSKAAKGDIKWETMVKSNKVQSPTE